MKTIVHDNKHIIARNSKTGSNDPPLTIKTYKTTQNAHEVKITGTIHVVNRPHKPLSCGARVWIEANGPVEILS